MEFLALVASIVAALVALYAVLVLPFRVRFARELKRKSRLELEAMALRYEDDYFGFIGHDHPDVVTLKQLIAKKDIEGLRSNWPRLSRAFVRLERKAGHTGRPLIMDYYNWHEIVLKQLSSRGV
jgi:hypothetical protein